MTRHILFQAAGLHLAIPAKYIKAIHESLSIQPVNGTLEWFLGLSVANGKLLPVTDLGAFAGFQSSQGRTLELESAVAVAALKVDNVAGLSEAQTQDAGVDSSDDELLADHLKLTGESVSDKGGMHRVLDLHALVQSSAFVDIKEQ